MKLRVKEFDRAYALVYLLDPKDNAFCTKMVWLPEHEWTEFEVCNYEISWQADIDDSETAEMWAESLIELLLNCEGDGKNVKWSPNENVLRIEAENDWELDVLLMMTERLVADFEDIFDIRSKVDSRVLTRL